MGDQHRGIYRKFEVTRTDGSSGPGGKHEGCNYFVLDLEHDPYAIPALKAYAAACEKTHPELATHLRRITSRPLNPPSCGCREAACEHVFSQRSPADEAEWLMATSDLREARKLRNGSDD